MGMRRVFLVAGLTTAAIAFGRRVVAHGSKMGGEGAAGGVVHGGWATCSAPSARWYDAAAGALLGGLYRRMADDLAAAVAGLHAPVVLEIGPGPGHLAVELARRVADLRLTGLDIDRSMVERAVARAERAGVQDRVTFRFGDVAVLPFPDTSFDLVTSSFSVHHWLDAAAGFAEIRRVLRPGGRAVVYDLPDRWGHVERRALRLADVAAAGGFAGATTAPFRWPGPVAFTNRLEGEREAEKPQT
jgi:SAM-dependent methyltransferase